MYVNWIKSKVYVQIYDGIDMIYNISMRGTCETCLVRHATGELYDIVIESLAQKHVVTVKPDSHLYNMTPQNILLI